jgi:hypothetical protein
VTDSEPNMHLAAKLQELAAFMYTRTMGHVNNLTLSAHAFDALAQELSGTVAGPAGRVVGEGEYIELMCAHGVMRILRGREEHRLSGGFFAVAT